MAVLLCTTMGSFATAHADIEKPTGCFYVTPKEQFVNGVLFQNLILRAHQENETFASILAAIENDKAQCHQFHFRYPLKDKDHAEKFAKVLHIKAQQAHRFVPVIASSQFTGPGHLGFFREITIRGQGLQGPRVQEHVLVDKAMNRVIFIEEWIATEDGLQPGSFASVNAVTEENGHWYFAGTYLYETPPTLEDLGAREEMFRETYENMLFFLEQEDLEASYQQLIPY